MKNFVLSLKVMNLTEIVYVLTVISLFGMFFFQITSTILPSLTGMNFIRDAISLLVYLPFGWMQTVAFYVFAISILSLAAILYLNARKKFNIGALLFVIMAVALILVGIFPTKFPYTSPTLSSVIHSWASRVVGLMFPLGCFFVAHVLKANKFRYLYIYTIAVGIVQVFLIIIGALFLQGMTGIYERILLWNGQIWIVVVSLNLLLAEVKNRLSESSWKRLVAQLSVSGALYMYATILLPL